MGEYGGGGAEYGGGSNVSANFRSASSSSFFFIICCCFFASSSSSSITSSLRSPLDRGTGLPGRSIPSRSSTRPLLTNRGTLVLCVDAGGTETLADILGAVALLRAAASVRRLRAWTGGGVDLGLGWLRVVAVDLGMPLSFRTRDPGMGMGLG